MSEKEVPLPGQNVPPKTSKPDEVQSLKPQSELPAGASAAEVVSFVLSKSQEELLPWEDIVLPSQGLYYGNQIPGGKVRVRPMGLMTDKILATPRLAQSGQALDEVYKRCVDMSNFDPLDLLVGDRVFILFVLRGITHGNLYEFMLKCPNEACGANSSHTYDLNATALTVKPPKHMSEPVRVVLPYLSEFTKRDFYVDVRFMRGRDTQIMSQKRKFVEKAVGQTARPKSQQQDDSPRPTRQTIIDQTLEENLNLLIINANGVTDRHAIAQLVTGMHGRDTATIRGVIRDEAPGLDTEIYVTCPECGTDIEMELPITDSFFRPKNNSRV
jgi:hypothetical protein